MKSSKTTRADITMEWRHGLLFHCSSKLHHPDDRCCKLLHSNISFLLRTCSHILPSFFEGIWVKDVTYLHLPLEDIGKKDWIYFFCGDKHYTWKATLYFLVYSFCIFTFSKCTFAKMWPICGFRIERSATVVVSLLTSTKVPCQGCWSN